MIKMICDRCGAEIKITKHRIVKMMDIYRTKSYDICGKCYAELSEWLSGARMEGQRMRSLMQDEKECCT